MFRPTLIALTLLLLLSSCRSKTEPTLTEALFSSPWSSEPIYISTLPKNWKINPYRASSLTLSKKEPLASITISNGLTLKVYDALYRNYEEHPPLGSLLNNFLTEKDSLDTQTTFREGFTQGGFIGLMGRASNLESEKESICWIFQVDSQHFHHLRNHPSKQAVNKTGSLFFELEGPQIEINKHFQDIEQFIHHFRLITPLENY